MSLREICGRGISLVELLSNGFVGDLKKNIEISLNDHKSCRPKTTRFRPVNFELRTPVHSRIKFFDEYKRNTNTRSMQVPLRIIFNVIFLVLIKFGEISVHDDDNKFLV